MKFRSQVWAVLVIADKGKTPDEKRKELGIMERNLIGFGFCLLCFAAGAVAQTVTGSGTTNTVPVFTGTSTVGNSPISVSGSNVGISATLTVGNGVTVGSGDLLLNRTDQNPAFITRPNTSGHKGIQIAVAGGGALDTFGVSATSSTFSGNVGVGVTNPTAPLHIGKAYAGSTNIPMQTWDPLIANYGLVLSNYNSPSGIDYRFTQYNNTGNIYPVLTFSGGNVGVGTTSPTQPLTLVGANSLPAASGTIQTGALRIQAAGQSSALDMGEYGSTGAAWIQSDAGPTNLATNYPLLLNPNGGNVGIGTSAPIAKLDVEGGSLLVGSGALNVPGNGDGTNPSLHFTTNAPASFNPGANIGLWLDSNGVINANAQVRSSGGYCIGSSCINAWPTAVSNNWNGAQTFSGAATFSASANFPSGVWNASGTLGVGTTNPLAKVDIVSTGNLYSNNEGQTNGLEIHSGTTTGTDYALYMGADLTNHVSYVQSVQWGTAVASLALNARGGRVGIGTANPGATLEVNGGLNFTGQSGTQTTPWTGVLCGGDYAEAVDTAPDKETYQPGDVLVIAEGAEGDVKKSAEPYATTVAGIFATKPGVVGRRQTLPKDGNEVPMAMVGIVPTKVIAENGPIRRGDLLVTSSTRGYAMKGSDRNRMLGAVIGKAMGSLDSGTGVIEVLVTLQ